MLELNIPIVLINEEKYNKKDLKPSNIFLNDRNYVINEGDESIKNFKI